MEKIGMSIPDFVKQHGWPEFRDVESGIARELSKQDNLIIDCGGGIIERPENIENLRERGRIFWLKASVKTIVFRIEGGTQRPPLTAGKSFTEEVEEVLERRTPLYRKASQFEIDTDQSTPEEISDEIIEKLK